ncbi:MAG: GntR family transcriptional regulator, partial [Desulfuromonadaceae bacterium]|nr:GntR family transcriptional regulator [Desulfuromonadaceae bacterium]
KLIVYALTDLGVEVVINNKYGGLIFNTELILKSKYGEQRQGYVRKIREDGKIDITLRESGAEQSEKDRRTILDALTAQHGFLPLTDKSSPEDIGKLLRLSKKSFKKVVGGLYKEGAVLIEPDGLRLTGR